MIPDLSMASPVSMRVQRTWPSHVRQKFAPLASRLWRKSRYELKWEAGFFTVPPGVCLCVLHFLCALLVLLSPQTEYARFENGRFVYRISRSPMCEYMINFIHKLKHLPEKYMMNSVLENFTILLVITSLTWVGDVPLWECFSRCCQDVLVAPAGFKKIWVGAVGGLHWALRYVPLPGFTFLSFHRGWNTVWGPSLSAGEREDKRGQETLLLVSHGVLKCHSPLQRKHPGQGVCKQPPSPKKPILVC